MYLPPSPISIILSFVMIWEILNELVFDEVLVGQEFDKIL